MKQEMRTADPYLIGAIEGSDRVPAVLYDLRKIKTLKLDERTKPCGRLTFLQGKDHDFSVIGEMESLHTLIMNTRNPLTVDDFSFLEKCKIMRYKIL